MSEIGKLIDRLAADALAAPLKAAGFHKTGRTWRRRAGDAIQVVNVQASKWNAGADGQLLLNAGVYFPSLAVRLALFPPTEAPAEYDCQVRTRPRLPGWAGRSWLKVRVPAVVTPDPAAGGMLGNVYAWLDRRANQRAVRINEKAVRELREALEQHGLPWLERMADLRGARDYLVTRGARWWAVAASLELGDRDQAERLFARVLAEASGGTDELLSWGRANGLAPAEK